MNRPDVPPTPRKAMTPKRRLEALLASNGRCARCKVKLGRRFDVDHDLPLELGGEETRANLVALCVPCHRGKTSAEDAPRIAKMRRQRNLRLDAPPTERKVRAIKSAPFRKDITRGMDGCVRPRKLGRFEVTQ